MWQWVKTLNPKRPQGPGAAASAYDIDERARRIANAKKGITHMGGL